jgi:DNA-binding transcriptional LysR family regulator
MDTWTFQSEQGEESVTVSGSFTINDPSLLITAAIEGSGVLLIDKNLLGETINQGSLVPLLENYQAVGGLPTYVVYPEKEFIPAKTKAMVNFLLERI